MLRITDSKSASGAKEYFDKSLRQADYYADGQEIVGLWHGAAAVRLGLSGKVEREAFHALLDNCDPQTGEQLTPRIKSNRRPGTDFTFNAPKSVSVLHAVTGDARIIDGFRRAVAATMGEVEADAKTRVRARGRNEDRTTGSLAWGEFLHTTARPVDGVPDPHLHIHAYVPNLTFDQAEGRWKALQLGDVKGDGAYYEAVFLSRLAGEMRALGYGVERNGRWWDVAGVPRSLVEQFSRRTSEIERTVAARGITDPDAKGEVGARTRQRKVESFTGSELRDLWLSRIGPADRAALDRVIADATAGGAGGGTITAHGAMEYALRHSFERASVTPERRLLTVAMHRSYGDAGPEAIRIAAARAPLIRRQVEGKALVSTKEVLAEESALLDFARRGRMTCRPLGPEGYQVKTAFLNAGQRRAVEHVLSSPDRLMVIRGGAGTGKTTLMSEAVEGVRAGGHKAFVFAPTSGARDVLRNEGFTSAETLQRLLIDTEMQKSLRQSVIWLDEAGLVSIPEMSRLSAIAAREDCRIILSGDSKQHASVGRGDALRLLETHAGIRPAEVREIVRQRGDYKDAVATVESGDIEAGFRRFERMGAVLERQGETRLDELAADYARETRAGKSVLLVSPTHREKDEVTARIRGELRHDGRLGATAHELPVLRDLRWTEAERSDPARYRGGEVVKFVQNAPGFGRGQRLTVEGEQGGLVRVQDGDGADRWLPLDRPERFKVYRRDALELRAGDLLRITENGASLDGHRLNNGATYRLRSFDAAGNLVLDDNGWTVARDFGHLDHGYCTTSVSAQGRTVDTVLVAMGEQSIPAMSREQFYVTVSRGRQAIRLYTDNTQAVREAIAESGARGSATELVEGKVDRSTMPAPRMERLKDYAASVARLMKERAWEHAAEISRGREREPAGRQVTEATYQEGGLANHAPEIGG